MNLCHRGRDGGHYGRQMKLSGKESKCLHCNEIFHAFCNNEGRQKYCGKEACRKESKQASQQRWTRKPENLKYFSGADEVKRVQEWRKAHPDYWRSKKKEALPLQDICHPEQPVEQEVIIKEVTFSPKAPLQDLAREVLLMKDPLVVGLISHLMACTLQGDIAQIMGRLVNKGRDILDQPSRTLTKGNLVYDDQKAAVDTRASTPDSSPFQLDRPPARSP